jgi:hypothetical protein
MGCRSFCGAIAVFAVMGFAPQPDPQRSPTCGGRHAAASSKQFVEGYSQAKLAVEQDRMAEAIALADVLELQARLDVERSALSSIRQAAYASLNDDSGALKEVEKQIDLGCLSTDRLRAQAETAAELRKKLGLPPQ